MIETQLDAHDEGEGERTGVDEAIERRTYLLERIEDHRRVLDWIERYTPQLCAIGVQHRYTFREYDEATISFYHLSREGVTFIASSGPQTRQFVDVCAFLSRFGKVNVKSHEGSTQTIVTASITDANDVVTFIFDTGSINEGALNGAEGKVE